MVTVTCILEAMFIGMIIGGFSGGNNTVGIIGVVLALLGTIAGIAAAYYKNKRKEREGNEQLFLTPQKIQHLIADPQSRETFLIAELESCVVDVLDALHELDDRDYFYLKKIHDSYQRDICCITVTYKEYIECCERIISNYDMVVPYYKVCKDPGISLAAMPEEGKIPYRIKAKNLMDDGKLFSDEWKLLNAKFYKEFYEGNKD